MDGAGIAQRQRGKVAPGNAGSSATARASMAPEADIYSTGDNPRPLGWPERKAGQGSEGREKRNIQHFQKNNMTAQHLSPAEIMQMILGEFDTESNTEVALEAYLFAKKIANAAAAAMKVTGDFATQKLIEQGGKGANEFAQYSIVRQYDRQYEPDESREAVMKEIEAQSDILKAISERLAAIEKEMEKAGRVDKKEVGQSIKVTLLDKI